MDCSRKETTRRRGKNLGLGRVRAGRVGVEGAALAGGGDGGEGLGRAPGERRGSHHLLFPPISNRLPFMTTVDAMNQPEEVHRGGVGVVWRGAGTCYLKIGTFSPLAKYGELTDEPWQGTKCGASKERQL